MKKSMRVLLTLTLALMLAAPAALAEKPRELRLGVVAWSEALAIGNVLEYLLEEKLGQPVNMTNPDVGVAYTAVKNKDLDAFIEVWLPLTHEAYWDKVASQVCDFGPIYENASLGWAVPNYIPESEVSSVTDLGKPGMREKFDGRITGIDPGSGLMQHSALMMKEYPELKDWKLIEGSDYAMVAALKRAMQRKEWIVVTLWRPHFAFARYDIRYIDEPRKVLGGEERAHMIGRRDFMDVFPSQVSMFLTRFYLPVSKVDELVDLYEQNDKTAARKFIEKYPGLVNYWLTGQVN